MVAETPRKGHEIVVGDGTCKDDIHGRTPRLGTRRLKPAEVRVVDLLMRPAARVGFQKPTLFPKAESKYTKKTLSLESAAG